MNSFKDLVMAEVTKRKRGWKKVIVPILVLLLLGSVAASVYLYRQMEALKDNPEAITEEEVAKLTALVGELIVLPTDELPTIATVVDAEKLKDQAFFANAKAGDRVLLYTNAKKAILYDPVAHKIVEVAPINIGDTQPIAEPSVAGANTEAPAPTLEVTPIP